MNTLDSLRFFSSELILLGLAFVVLIADLFTKNKRFIGLISLAGLSCALLFSVFPSNQSIPLFYGAFTLDGVTFLFKLAIYFMVGATMMISLTYDKIGERSRAEYYSLLLFLAIGLTLMAAATNFIMLVISVEFVSITSYALVGYLKNDSRSNEAAIKYLLFGSVCSAIMLYGISLVWGLTGTIQFADLAHAIQTGAFGGSILWVALVLILTGIGFKISMAPFHMWAPDVYQGAPMPITALLTVAPKSLGFIVLIRVLFGAFGPAAELWSPLIVLLSMITMSIGNILAISQTNVKRLFAYSSIAHAGYILMGIAVANRIGIIAVIIYLLAYIITNLGIFITLFAVSESEGSDEIEAYTGLSQRSPFLAIALTVFALSLTGIPPLAGFIGKWYVFAATIKSGYIALALVAAVNSVVAAFYYLRIIRAMYLENPTKKSALSVPKSTLGPLLVTLALTVVFGLSPTPWIQCVHTTLASWFGF